MQIQKVPYEGWQNNAALSNNHVELIITLDVGPRIISYRTPRGQNVFKNYDEQIGGSGEAGWMIRGGHRLWTAPEFDVTYTPDNTPVTHELLPNGIRLENKGVGAENLHKILTITLAEDSSEVTVHHRVINEGDKAIEIASWGLSVMAPGGLEIIPQPELGEHPRDLLPNRVIVPWPYTDLTEPRWRIGSEFITLCQTPESSPTKLGLSHKEKWIAYLNGESLFVKTIDFEEGATYPDLGCNFETYTDSNMLEIESLSPLRKLQPGESVEHTEKWYLMGNTPQPTALQDQDLGEWIQPLLEKLGV